MPHIRMAWDDACAGSRNTTLLWADEPGARAEESASTVSLKCRLEIDLSLSRQETFVGPEPHNQRLAKFDPGRHGPCERKP